MLNYNTPNSFTGYFLIFPVDGRLEKELEYVTKTLGEGAGTTNQILIQTAKESQNGNVLSAQSLLTHLEILQEAASVSVDMFDTYVGPVF